MAKRTSLTKEDKIKLVRRFGLNTETNIVIKTTEPEDLDKLETFVNYHNLSKVSIRTQAIDNSRSTPHYPIIEVKDLFHIVRELVDSGYHAIVATPIDPKDAVLAGAVLKEGSKFTLEFAIGPYTVRRVTHQGIIDINLTYDVRTKEVRIIKLYDDLYLINLIEIISQCRKVPISECIIELSYYRIPVGHRNNNIIIWDIDSTGTEESTTEIESFYFDIPRL